MFIKNKFNFTFKVNQSIILSKLQNCEILTNSYSYNYVIENDYCLGSDETIDLYSCDIEEFISNFC